MGRWYSKNSQIVGLKLLAFMVCLLAVVGCRLSDNGIRGNMGGSPSSPGTPPPATPPDPYALKVISSGPVIPQGKITEIFPHPNDSNLLYYSADYAATGYNDLYEYNLTTQKSRVIANSISSRLRPQNIKFTPDGNSMIYVWYNSAGSLLSSLMKSNLDGSGSTILATCWYADTCGALNISSDSLNIHTVFRWNNGTNSNIRAVTIPLDGSSIIEVNDSLDAINSGVREQQYTSDFSRIVYLSDRVVLNKKELWAADTDGSNRVQLSPAMAGDRDVHDNFAISPDNLKVVFAADINANDVYEIFTVDLDGTNLMNVSHGNVAGGNAYLTSANFSFSPDSAKVYYIGDIETNNVNEIFMANADGSGGRTKVSGALQANGDVQGKFWLTNDGSKIVYWGDADVDGANEVYSVNSGGGGLQKLSPVALDNTWGVPNQSIWMTPDTNWVVYRYLLAGVWAIYSAKVDGTSTQQLNQPWGPGNLRGGPIISPDSNWVLYSADRETAGLEELYIVSIDGVTHRKVSGTMPANADVDNFYFSDDSGYVYFTADKNFDDQFSLYIYNISTQSVTDLSPPSLPDGRIMGDSFVDTNSENLFYISGVSGDYSLYKANIDGSGTPTQLTGPTSANLLFNSYDKKLTPDGNKVLHPGGYGGFFATSVDGSGSVDLMASPAYSFASVRNPTGHYKITPDGQRVIYISNHLSNLDWDLFSIKLDGTGIVTLNAALPGSEVFTDLAMTSDGRIVYSADENTLGRWEIFIVNADGTGKTLLSNPMVPTASCTQPMLAPDESKVVFAGDRTVDSQYDLYSVNLDGTGIQKLSVINQANGDASASTVKFTSDSQKIVFRCDCEVDFQYDLYSVDLDGSNLQRLTAGIVASGSVLGAPIITGDNQKVIFYGDYAVDGKYELYIVNIDGTGITRLDAFGADGDVNEIQLTPDSSRIIFKGVEDSTVENKYELYSVKLDGTGLVKLSLPIALEGDIQYYEISSDSKYVLYRADGEIDSTVETYVVPIDGSSTAEKVHSDLSAGQGTGQTDRAYFSPDSKRVIIESDLDLRGQRRIFTKLIK